MIEIIKHGKLKKGIAKCPNCGCEFSFDERDLEQAWYSKNGVLTCPECERTVKDWEWVEENHNETCSITELNLEKEIDKYCEPIQAWQIQEAPYTSMENCARHFYELGQCEMRNRITNPEYNKQVVERMKSEHPIAANEEELKKAIKERYPMPEDADAHTRDRIMAARNGFLSGYSYELGRKGGSK